MKNKKLYFSDFDEERAYTLDYIVKEMKKSKLCVFLLPVSTSTKLFHKYIKTNATEIEFVEGRIKFGKIQYLCSKMIEKVESKYNVKLKNTTAEIIDSIPLSMFNWW